MDVDEIGQRRRQETVVVNDLRLLAQLLEGRCRRGDLPHLNSGQSFDETTLQSVLNHVESVEAVYEPGEPLQNLVEATLLEQEGQALIGDSGPICNGIHGEAEATLRAIEPSRRLVSASEDPRSGSGEQGCLPQEVVALVEKPDGAFGRQEETVKKVGLFMRSNRVDINVFPDLPAKAKEGLRVVELEIGRPFPTLRNRNCQSAHSVPVALFDRCRATRKPKHSSGHRDLCSSNPGVLRLLCQSWP